MGRKPAPDLLDPYETLHTKAQGYIRNEYPRVQAFSVHHKELGRVQQAVGGSVHEHGTGYLWVLSDKVRIEFVLGELEKRGLLPTKHKFEEKVR